uniref:Uncharacterized protein n=1 Tax=Setaria italica TaxID=4555 RepID=K3XQU8_SETIT
MEYLIFILFLQILWLLFKLNDTIQIQHTIQIRNMNSARALTVSGWSTSG